MMHPVHATPVVGSRSRSVVGGLSWNSAMYVFSTPSVGVDKQRLTRIL